jgi:hypothetical protein
MREYVGAAHVRHVPVAARKLIRYPVGTVAVLRAGAAGVSRGLQQYGQRSGRPFLGTRLGDQPGTAVERRLPERPAAALAVPLIGGVSRIASATPDELITMLIDSVITRNRSTRAARSCGSCRGGRTCRGSTSEHWPSTSASSE